MNSGERIIKNRIDNKTSIILFNIFSSSVKLILDISKNGLSEIFIILEEYKRISESVGDKKILILFS